MDRSARAARSLPAAAVATVAGVVGAGVGSLATIAVRARRRRTGQPSGASPGSTADADRALLDLAETLQRSLLTAAPQLPWLATAVRYRPATAGAHVGGDWYDAFAVPDGTTLLVVADVAGHDAVAAATMAQVRGVLRGLAQSVVGSPAGLLAALDRALDDLHVGTLVSMVVATVEPRAAEGGVRLRWTNAGHPPPVRVRADGGVELLDPPVDPPLGLAPGLPRADHELVLGAGDTLVLYTDGLVESRTADLDAGLAVLAETLQGAQERSPDEVCDGVLRRLGRRAGDDVALLVARPLS